MLIPLAIVLSKIIVDGRTLITPQMRFSFRREWFSSERVNWSWLLENKCL